MKTAPLFVLLALAVPAAAQFYAPDTEFHDIAQRTFPVEAARVLAWQRNQADAKIADVQFDVQTTAARETVWSLRWLDAAGKTVRAKTVRYPESLLVQGPEFFREVFRQIAGDDWKIESGSPDNAATAFWQGAELAGVSRAEAITAAGKFLSEKPRLPRAADAARIAGILSHGALPMLGNQLTIDRVLLSRAAAWLSIAELRLREPLDAAWAPILFLSGREKLAENLWQGSPLRNPEKRSGAERFWAAFLARPSVKDGFLFAAKRENRQFAMPMMTLFTKMDLHYARVIVELADTVLEDRWRRLHDYAPLLSTRAGVAAGHLTSASPADARTAWMQALRAIASDGAEVPAVKQLLENKIPGDATAANAAVGLETLAPVMKLAAGQQGDHLAPVAHVTVHDLLGFGWENELVQLGAHHRFLRGGLGVPDAAKELAQRVFASLPAAERYLLKAGVDPVLPPVDPRRLEFLLGSLAGPPLDNKTIALDSARSGLRRGWIDRDHIDANLEALTRSGAPVEELKQMLMRAHSEGGPLVDLAILSRLLQTGDSEKLRLIEGRDALVRELAQELPAALFARTHLAWLEHHNDPAWLAYGQALERIGWEGLHPVMTSQVFSCYIQANAIASAKRYYDEIGPFITDRISFSNALGPRRWALAWLEDDRPTMDRVLRDNATFSQVDLRLRATDALAREDAATAERQLQMCIERYRGAEAEKHLLAFLPLIPALKDAAHVDHGKALDHFTSDREWPLVQWMLAKQSKLSPEETARFFGGDKATPLMRALLAGWREDRAAFERAYGECAGEFGLTPFVLVHRLRAQLFEIQPAAEQSDLKPPGLKPLAQLVADAASGQQSEESAKAFDITQFKSADEAWAAVETLREFKPARTNSPQDQMRVYRDWLARRRTAAQAFEKAYAKDPRHWDAQLLAIDSAGQLARFGDRSVNPAEKDALEAVLAAADASADAKGEAAFVLTTMAGAGVDPNSPHTLPPFHRALSEYLEKYPHHRRAPHIAMMQLQLLEAVETPGAENLLNKLAAHPNAQIASQAKAVGEQRATFVKLKKEPLDLKFTASDGAEIDLAQLRGKVVLLDFWASWCGPCIAEAPHVVAAYEKFRERGFAVVGISLDQDRAAMDAAARKHRMAWPHCFDADRGEQQIAKRFGIRSIPAAWLFDKKGLLRQTGLRGAELQTAIERLLAE